MNSPQVPRGDCGTNSAFWGIVVKATVCSRSNLGTTHIPRAGFAPNSLDESSSRRTMECTRRKVPSCSIPMESFPPSVWRSPLFSSSPRVFLENPKGPNLDALRLHPYLGSRDRRSRFPHRHDLSGVDSPAPAKNLCNADYFSAAREETV